jgi:hypothetical protein
VLVCVCVCVPTGGVVRQRVLRERGVERAAERCICVILIGVVSVVSQYNCVYYYDTYLETASLICWERLSKLRLESRTCIEYIGVVSVD